MCWRFLAEAEKADFVHLGEVLGVTDGNLSRHLSVLEEAGYIIASKTTEGKRTRTWVMATRAGRAAFDQHLTSLRKMMSQVREP